MLVFFVISLKFPASDVGGNRKEQWSGVPELPDDGCTRHCKQKNFFGGDGQSLGNASFPGGLQQLTFGTRFNQRLDNVNLPGGLRQLTFRSDFRLAHHCRVDRFRCVRVSCLLFTIHVISLLLLL